MGAKRASVGWARDGSQFGALGAFTESPARCEHVVAGCRGRNQDEVSNRLFKPALRAARSKQALPQFCLPGEGARVQL